MMFTILFGLSMDYEVFLLSRIREEWLHTGDNATAVADGLATTARVITAAAAIMVCVFGSFVLGDQRVLKLFGLGLATAVFVARFFTAAFFTEDRLAAVFREVAFFAVAFFAVAVLLAFLVAMDFASMPRKRLERSRALH